MTRTADQTLVARLLAIVGGEAPIADAERLLAPDVICHMDRYTVRGIDAWIDWVEFIRSRAGGFDALKVDVERYETHPDGTITAFGWLRGGAGMGRPPQQSHARYRVAGGRIAEIWTTRGNYEMIFGAKARHPLSWLLVLVEMALWRRLPCRSRARPSHASRGSRERSRNEPRRRRQADDDPERRHSD